MSRCAGSRCFSVIVELAVCCDVADATKASAAGMCSAMQRLPMTKRVHIVHKGMNQL